MEIVKGNFWEAWIGTRSRLDWRLMVREGIILMKVVEVRTIVSE